MKPPTKEQFAAYAALKLAGLDPLDLASNNYGNIDIRPGKGFDGAALVYIPEGGELTNRKLAAICRAKGIRYARAMVGFSNSGGRRRKYFSPNFTGIVVAPADARTIRRVLLKLAKGKQKPIPETQMPLEPAV